MRKYGIAEVEGNINNTCTENVQPLSGKSYRLIP